MISAIDLMDVDERATATPLDCGVVFRLPFSGAGVLILASLGYASEAPTDLAEVKLSDFKEQTKALDFFGYRGCDLLHHYFAMPDGEGYRIARSVINLDPMPIQLGFCLLVAFRNGTLTIPDPQLMIDIDPQEISWALSW